MDTYEERAARTQMTMGAKMANGQKWQEGQGAQKQ